MLHRTLKWGIFEVQKLNKGLCRRIALKRGVEQGQKSCEVEIRFLSKVFG